MQIVNFKRCFASSDEESDSLVFLVATIINVDRSIDWGFIHSAIIIGDAFEYKLP